ncbi:MAG: chromosome segregation protein SMC [Acidiferrobacterales bacterium]
MRLKTIKLAGFKSFVDPTSVPVSGNLIGIVGPNGCGKSNIIDAIRWVMGETSAKHLRGDSMADVIFNGSSARKPIGRASVELLFDNSDGTAPGEYARYAEISIRREASRNGYSDYFLNKTRCRRKDIIGLFLGTGLGPRAYSIIEQDMVSRVVEAKPEDLRAFFEEAAGISKYKERRRETETRIRHTRENLARVEDIRSELATQLRRLRRQSNAAARYKDLKQQERLTRAQWLVLRWRALDEQAQEAERATAAQDIALESAVADQRAIEARIEKIRTQQTEATDHFNTVQAEFYSIGAEIAGVEQATQHARNTHHERARELEQVNLSWQEASQHLQSDLAQLKELSSGLEQGAPRINEALTRREDTNAALQRAELAMRGWQGDWNAFAEAAAEPAQAREIQHARIEQLRRHLKQLEERAARLGAENEEIVSAQHGIELEGLRQRAAELEQACGNAEQQLETVERGIKQARELDINLARSLEELRGEQHTCDARLASLRELQAAAEGRDNTALNAWLSQRNLEQAPRLAGVLSVEPGWERAVERVLGVNLAAVCVNGLDRVAASLRDDEQLELAVFDLEQAPGQAAPSASSMLLDKVRAEADLGPLLGGVYVAEGLGEALRKRAELASHESIVTRSGVWLGRNWLTLAHGLGSRAGMLAREQEIEKLEAQSGELHQKLDGATEKRARVQERLQGLESERERRRSDLNEQLRERAAIQAQRAHKEATLTQLQLRAQRIGKERNEVKLQLERDNNDLSEAQRLLHTAEGETDTHEEQRQILRTRRDQLQAELEQARAAAAQAQEVSHQLEVEQQRMHTACESIRQSVTRLDSQIKQLAVRREELDRMVVGEREPDAELKQRLEEFLQRRLQVEQRLHDARKKVGDLDAAIREQEQARSQQAQKIEEIRKIHEEARVYRQELVVRRDGLGEQVAEANFDLKEIIEELPKEASEQAWQARIEELQAKIERLGAINLVAVEEYEEQSERKHYLDKQDKDLSDALETLEEAIRKMDRESRIRFKETFDKVNAGFQSFFPRLFGGGSAYLDLTENDLLSTGVTVMAHPPGKRTSTIHLLSGGEKALTAVALLFSLFELTPAPFCLLDEVDAPLDDANVERYCETLMTLSDKTQLIYVTHNKISMETAKVLIGVTMTEPGVSRLVAVDIDEALEMAAR